MVKKPRNTDIFLILLILMVYGHSNAVATTTVAGTTAAGTTVAGTTVAGTTVAGTTAAGTTVAGTTLASTTVAGTTVAGTTVASTTVAGTTVAGTTATGTTVAGTTTTAATTVGSTNCTDKSFCTELTTAVCQYSSMVSNCPVLCHTNTSCNVTTDRSTVRTSFRLTDEVYNTNLANPSSTAFIALKTSVENKTGAALTRELGGRFVSIVVNGFTRGSVVVDADITIAEEDQRVAIETVTKAIIDSGVSGLDISSVKLACSSGFINVNNQCMMFGNQRLTWSASGSACGRLNGRLVVPTDFQKMASYILRKNLFYWQYWVGASATNQSDPSTYKWLDGTVVDSSLWYSGFPKTPGTSPGITLGQACVKLHPNSNTNNGLIGSSDSNCNGTDTYRYICEEL